MSKQDERIFRSEIANEARLSMARTIAQLTHEQRLIAFLEHCQLMTALHIAGRQHQQARRQA
jgi:hypothetical protein